MTSNAADRLLDPQAMLNLISAISNETSSAMAMRPSHACREQARPEQELRQLGDSGRHAPLARRRFVKRIVRATSLSAAAAVAATTLLESSAKAAIIADDDPRLATSRGTYTGATGEIGYYLAMPADTTAALPAITVLHEDCGLDEHIEDVTRRIALAGFVAIAPDFLSPHGGTPADEAAARQLIGEAGDAQTIGDAVAAIRFLEAHPATTGKIGVTGLCWGGDLAHRAAVAVPELGATVAWHGKPPPAEDAAKVRSPLMMHQAALDRRTTAAVTDYAAALDAAGVAYTLFIYEGVNGAFQNDTNQASYVPATAALAWQRTIDFFKAKLAT